MLPCVVVYLNPLVCVCVCVCCCVADPAGGGAAAVPGGARRSAAPAERSAAQRGGAAERVPDQHPHQGGEGPAPQAHGGTAHGGPLGTLQGHEDLLMEREEVSNTKHTGCVRCNQMKTDIQELADTFRAAGNINNTCLCRNLGNQETMYTHETLCNL